MSFITILDSWGIDWELMGELNGDSVEDGDGFVERE